MADRFQRGAGAQVAIKPFEVPDLQSGIAKQLSFLDTMQKMQQREAAMRAAQAAATQGTFIGVDPATGEPVYMKGLPSKITDAQRKQALAAWLQQKAKTVIGQDEELNRIKGELYSGRPVSIKRQNELLQQARTRTALLAKEHGIDSSAAFQQTFGEAQKTQAKDAANYEEAGPGSAFLAGLEQGWNTLKSGIAQAFAGSNAEKAQIARENTRRNQEIALANPILRERTLREGEAAAEGKELGYFDAVEGGTFSNLAATAGNLAGTFGPAMVATPALAYAGAPALAASLAPSIAVSALAGQEGYNERVVNTEGLTEQQKEDALDLTNPGAALNLGVNAAAGALLPGRVLSGAKQWVGNRVASGIVDRELSKIPGAVAANGMLPAPSPLSVATPLQARAIKAGQMAAAKAAAPRTKGTLVRDIIGNAGENAAIMGGATIGSNYAYNMGAGQDAPLTQGFGQGVVEGALLGVPFGYMHWRGRTRPVASPTNPNNPANGTAPQPPRGGASSEVRGMFGSEDGSGTSGGSKTGFTGYRRNNSEYYESIVGYLYPDDSSVEGIIGANKAFSTNGNADLLNGANAGAFKTWLKQVVAASIEHNDAKVDALIGEYLASGGRIEDLEYILYTNPIGKEMKSALRLDPLTSINVPGWKADARKTFAAGVAYAKRQGDGYAGQFKPRKELSDVLGKLNRAGENQSGGEGDGTGGAMGADTKGASEGATTGDDAPSGSDDSATKGGGSGGTASQGDGTNETTTASTEGGESSSSETSNFGRDASGAGADGKPTGDGTGSTDGQAGGSNGGSSDAATTGAGTKPPLTVMKEAERKANALSDFNTRIHTNKSAATTENVDSYDLVNVANTTSKEKYDRTEIRTKDGQTVAYRFKDEKVWRYNDNPMDEARSYTDKNVGKVYDVGSNHWINDLAKALKSKDYGPVDMPKKAAGIVPDADPILKRLKGNLLKYGIGRADPATRNAIRKDMLALANIYKQKLPAFVSNLFGNFTVRLAPRARYAGQAGIHRAPHDITINAAAFGSSVNTGLAETVQHEISHILHWNGLSPTVRNALFNLYERNVVTQGWVHPDDRNNFLNGYYYKNSAKWAVSGDEAGAEFVYGRSDWNPTIDNIERGVDTMTAGVRAVFTDNPQSIDAIRDMMISLAVNRTPAELRDALIDAVIATPEVRSMYLDTNLAQLQAGLSTNPDASPLSIITAQDYIRLTDAAGVPRNEASLREYLTEVFDPTTRTDVYSRDTKVC